MSGDDRAVCRVVLACPPYPHVEVPTNARGAYDRIERLEEELRRVKDQADFTEKLLSDRSGDPGDELSGP